MSGEAAKDMRKKSNPTKYAVTIPWPLIVACALAAMVLGLLGFRVESGCTQPGSSCNYIVTLNDIWRTLNLILSAGEIQERRIINIYLVLARLFAVLFAMGAIVRVVIEFLGDRFTLFRARRREVHTIIVGCGERGQHFLCDCQGDSNDRPVVVDRLNDPAILQRTRDAKALFLQGDARNSTLLADAGLAHARRLIILGGEDTQNLEVLAAAQTVVRKEAEPLRVVVRIDNPLLVRQLERDDDFAGGPGFDVTAFNLAATTARCFFRAHPLVDQAELRAQRRIHLVCVGWTPFVFAVIEQLARLSPFRSFSKPSVHLLVTDENALRIELDSVQPAIRELLDIKFEKLDKASSIPSPQQIKSVEPDADTAVTAILVSVGNDAETAATALAIRERSQQNSRWRAPVYAHLEARSSLSTLLEQRSRMPDPAEAVIPVGFYEDSCRIDALFGERDDVARRIHRSYLAFKGIDDSAPANQRADNDQPWESLNQTYRLACRRAADHFPIKILSIGARQSGSPFIASENLSFAASQDELELLSELEHRSWEIDRRLDGWRPGAHRDNQARIHPALVPYQALSEEVKDFDRDQIHAIAQHLLEEGGTPTVKREVRLGIFGHNKVTRDDKAHMLQELDRTVMPGFIHSHQHDFVSVCTPLAPGTDTILTEAILSELKKADIDHRLIVIRSLPLQIVVDEFEDNFADDVEWRLEDQAASSRDWLDVKKQITAHLTAIPVQLANSYVANLIPPGLAIDDFESADKQRTHSYERAAAWLVERCHTLIAFFDSGRKSGRGGTRETLRWARGEKSIPRNLSTLHPGEDAQSPRMITIEALEAPPA